MVGKTGGQDGGIGKYKQLGSHKAKGDIWRETHKLSLHFGLNGHQYRVMATSKTVTVETTLYSVQTLTIHIMYHEAL